LTHTILVLVTVGFGHGVYKKLYTLIGGQLAEKFENHWSKRTFAHSALVCTLECLGFNKCLAEPAVLPRSCMERQLIAATQTQVNEAAVRFYAEAKRCLKANTSNRSMALFEEERFPILTNILTGNRQILKYLTNYDQFKKTLHWPLGCMLQKRIKSVLVSTA